MSAQEDTESSKGYTPIRAYLTRRPQGGTGIVSAIFAWSVGTLNILNGMRSELGPDRFYLGVKIIEQWGKVMPLVLKSGKIPMLVTADKAEDIRMLFVDTEALATLIRIVRPILPHVSENEDRDEIIIAETHTFCDEKLELLRGFGGNDFDAEAWLFAKLVHHTAQLLNVALGDRHMERFDREYGEMTKDLETQIALNAKPEN